MEATTLGSGDTTNAQHFSVEIGSICNAEDKPELPTETGEKNPNCILTTRAENEIKLKNRIAQCRSIIESLKIELNEEKKKLVKDVLDSQRPNEMVAKCTPISQSDTPSETLLADAGYSTMYAECVENKIECDESLMKYEKQLQKYQNTLNMAQIEKKNAIRKQMLSKAYRLKLMEVENQCNIELLRVKQSLQCLEPLQMIAKKWKVNMDDTYDANNFELIPRYPELGTSSTSELNSLDEFDLKFAAEKTAIED